MNDINRILWLFLAALFVAVAVQFGMLIDTRNQIEENGETTIENRIIGCRILVVLGLPIDPAGPCADPRVRGLYDPDETTTTVGP